jgi:toxin CcdB
MAQLDVYRNRSTQIPYLLDVQADLLDYLKTRVVVPLRRQGSMIKGNRLNPVFSVEDTLVVMATAEIAAVRLTALGERVTSLQSNRDDIINAIDVLWTGV